MNPELTRDWKRSNRTTAPADDKLKPAVDLTTYCRQYARERPEVVALWCFGIGFTLGWKLKPW
jgi:hypothetical protein